ncbi:efflux RND transporter periplasmic adaptor subunit [Shumkonia mesophila]|uniref:efflux RND transporter periplasmic adaptor subunit n=1 Tax=Shumkonia mesophila TaxID=2838854 RepID=UPI00293430C3|nr:efflux RND transporter periplasmic adaptor subunit [Shumkonia mesophila]
MRSAAALACLGLAFLGACDEPPPQPAEVRPVRTIVVNAGSEGELASGTGHIRARTEKNLAFRIDGRVISRKVDVGQMVKPGDLVAELDAQPQRDALRAEQAKLSAAKAVLAEAANNLERQRKLLEQGWATAVRFDAAEKTFRSATAEVHAIEATVHTAEERLGYTRLQADGSGVVTTTGAEAGEVVRAGQMIVTVAEDDGFDAVFDVSATLMRQIDPDATIDILLTDDPNVRTTGRVREVSPQANPVTRSFQVKVGLTERPQTMRLGATVSGQVRLLATDGIELPATALTMMDNKAAVWVVDPENLQVAPRSVEVQRQNSASIIVSTGLASGERVVTAGVHALRPGQKVRLEEVAP